MSGFGSFSQEAYDQLRQAYSDQLQRAEEVEEAGVQIGQDKLGVETAPVRSDWLDKTGLWKYPDGRGERQDMEQKQVDLLAALRDENGDLPDGGEEDSDSDVDLEAMSDEEIDSMIDEILGEIDDAEEGEEAEAEGEEELGEEEQSLLNLLAEISEEELDAMSDEEFDELIDGLLEGIRAEEPEAADVDGGEEEPSAEDIAARIAELKAELASLTESNDEEGEEEEDYEPEETQGEEEETEPEVPENDTEEEDPSDDEPN